MSHDPARASVSLITEFQIALIAQLDRRFEAEREVSRNEAGSPPNNTAARAMGRWSIAGNCIP